MSFSSYILSRVDSISQGEYWIAIVDVFLLLFLIYLIKIFLKRYGRRTGEVIRSVSLSVFQAISSNLEVQKMVNRYPRFFSFLKKRLSRNSFFGLPLTLISAIFLYVFFLFIGILQDVLASEQITGADHRIAQLFIYFRDPEFVKIFSWITLLGKWPIIIGLALAVSVILLIWKKKDYLLYLWIALGLDELFNYLMKIIIRRPRPSNSVYLKDSFSFPSGHAMISIVFYGFLSYLLIRHFKKWKQRASILFVWFILALAIGFSRLYLGVHYLSDVWAGYLLGFLILMTVITVYRARQSLNNINQQKGDIILTGIRTKKLITTGIIIVSFVCYAGFASFYKPALAPATVPKTQYISGNVLAYFSSHNIPKYSETITGQHQEPLNFIFFAKNDDALIKDFEKSSWFLADRFGLSSGLKIAKAAATNKEYSKGPMTPSFWNGIVHNFGFEKPTKIDTIRQRHHIRVWKTNLKEGEYSIYVATASLDQGIKYLITHKINPDIDTEKEFIKNNLELAEVVTNSQEVQFVKPVLGENFSNDPFFTNGKLFIIYLK